MNKAFFIRLQRGIMEQKDQIECAKTVKKFRRLDEKVLINGIVVAVQSEETGPTSGTDGANACWLGRQSFVTEYEKTPERNTRQMV